jgi:hypothetical protein
VGRANVSSGAPRPPKSVPREAVEVDVAAGRPIGSK